MLEDRARGHAAVRIEEGRPVAESETSGRLSVEGLVKDYMVEGRANRVVDGVSFEVPAGQLYSLLGPSGCGKTTTLRCVAGLEEADGGTIRVGDEILTGQGRNIPPDRRGLGMVFQSYAIWPHMTVFENAAFPLRAAKTKTSRAELKRRVLEALDMVQLSPFSRRLATQLSGGQQQRLALARALTRRPRVLLLDEPLSNLDAKLRAQMRGDVRELQQRLGITTLFVTHDQAEALSMSDRVAVMGGGRIVQEGSPTEVYQRPSCRYVADFVGKSNFIDSAIVECPSTGGAVLSALGSRIATALPSGARVGSDVVLSVRPEDIRIHTSRPDAENLVEGTVERVEFLGDSVECVVEVLGRRIVIQQNPYLEVTRGQHVFVELRHEACTVLSEDHGVAFGRGDETTSTGTLPRQSDQVEETI